MRPWLRSPPHARWLGGETDRLLDFAEASRHPGGGFAWLDTAGRPLLDRPVQTWVTARLTHAFALGHLLGRPGCGPLVDHGVAALRGLLHDAEHGGWYAAAPAVDGGVASPPGAEQSEKRAYEHGFVVLAASSAAVADRPGARELLDEALATVQQRFWEQDAGMVADVWDRGWTILEAYRGANANMHTVEAFLAASDVTGDDLWRRRALQICERVVREARARDWRLPEHFDSRWVARPEHSKDRPADPFRPYGVTVGHQLEWSRLCLHLEAALGPAAPEWLPGAAVALYAAAVERGEGADGAAGFVYTLDWADRAVVRSRLHWVLAEAIGAAAALHERTGEERYEHDYRRWWDLAARSFLDRDGGSWWHELDPDGRPSTTVWDGKPDVYHALQATLIPRLPLAPSLASALGDGLLR